MKFKAYPRKPQADEVRGFSVYSADYQFSYPHTNRGVVRLDIHLQVDKNDVQDHEVRWYAWHEDFETYTAAVVYLVSILDLYKLGGVL